MSSNELFHFTRYESLKSIIKSKSFYPRFNLEFTHLSDSFQRKAAMLPVAMVCFCDIPFEFSKKHRERYGNQGIVLTEEWKLRKGLNPIFYIQSNSFLANVIANLTSITEDFIPIIKNKNYGIEIPLTLANAGQNLTYLTYFLKQFENKKEIAINYEGKIRVFEKRKFYDEREWRYIPFEAENNDELFITIWDYDNPDKLEIANKKLEKYNLTFEHDDIKYLIVNNEEQRIELESITKELFNLEIEIKVVN